jgi:hypothetical protein
VKRPATLLAAVAAALAALVGFTLPPRHLALAPGDDGTVAGIVHVHTNRSDGLSPPDVIAAAAARAGLEFVVFTDHGDATRPADPPAYRSGVLCLDGVEISTNGGHYIAIDMPAAPYPLAGEARDVVEDVRRLGGFGIAAHPDSPKPQLAWRDWQAAVDGIELLNPDTSWRLIAARPGWAPKERLAAALVHYPFRAPEVIANLIQPTGALPMWEHETRTRRVVAIAGADAHAKLALRSADPGDSRFALPLPGYEASFRAMSVHVHPGAPPTGDAAADAAAILGGIRSGHLYTAVDGLASPPSFTLTAANGVGEASGGDEIAAAGPLLVHVRSNAPPAFTTIVHEGLSAISSVKNAPDLVVHASGRPAAYWAEIVAPTSAGPTTWLRSNPIYVRAPAPARLERAAGGPAMPRQGASAADVKPLFDGRSTTGWHVEHDATSVAAVDFAGESPGAELRFRFGLAGGAAVGQWVAVIVDTPSGISAYRQLATAIRAEQPMRVSVQFRDTAADRWQRSVYIDRELAERTIGFDDLTPVGVTPSPLPSAAAVRSILFVVDTTNTKPGTSARLWIGRADLLK